MSQMIDNLLEVFDSQKEVTVYPTYAYRNLSGDTWTIPLKIWVHKKRESSIEHRLINYYINRLLRDDEEFARDEDTGSRIAKLKRFLRDMSEPPVFEEGTPEFDRFRECIADFVADDDHDEPVSLQFDDDSERYDLSASTDLNGLVMEDLRIPDSKIQTLLNKQKATENGRTGWLDFKAFSDNVAGAGRVRVMFEPEGVCIVSDIDDTIKVTEVPAGKKIVLRNTFLREFVFVPEMLARYLSFADELKDFGGLSFHYVSGSPWQLYRILSKFLINESGFPEGTFHMKSARKNLFDPQSWKDIKNLIAGREATRQQKLEQIRGLMTNLPNRKFVLIGDSGELDPEVFKEIRADARFSKQVEKIIIRDVLEARFKGIDEIVAVDVPVLPGVSQFDKRAEDSVDGQTATDASPSEATGAE